MKSTREVLGVEIKLSQTMSGWVKIREEGLIENPKVIVLQATLSFSRPWLKRLRVALASK